MDLIVQYLDRLDSVTSWEEVFDIIDAVAVVQQESSYENQHYTDNDGLGSSAGDGIQC